PNKGLDDPLTVEISPFMVDEVVNPIYRICQAKDQGQHSDVAIAVPISRGFRLSSFSEPVPRFQPQSLSKRFQGRQFLGQTISQIPHARGGECHSLICIL